MTRASLFFGPSEGMRGFHGTSSVSLDMMFSGKPSQVRKVFTESNISLGGIYITKDQNLAKVYAEHASRVQGGRPVILEIDLPSSDLLPDEDWVVKAVKSSHLTVRLQDFMDDLFIGYPGEGWSLSDHYKERYDELNERHGITWRDSWRWSQSARMERPIRPEEVVEVKEVV